ncbi:hypothetical protein TK5_09280 [Sideroxyarcus sp. TK5]
MLTLCCLVCSWSAQATAPRIAPQMFGEEKKADIVGFQFSPKEAAAKSENALLLDIVTVAFKAAGQAPVLDVLPAKQLATYALQNDEAAALMGSLADLPAKERGKYRAVTFYLGSKTTGNKAVALIFSKTARGNALHRAFSAGLRDIIRSGKYLEILETYHGKGQVPADYAARLKRQNPGWK